MKIARSIAAVLLVAGSSRAIAQGRASLPPIAGCYDVSRGAWPASLRGDSSLHAIPPHVRLENVAIDGGSWKLSPDIVYPRAGRFAPKWMARGDSIVLVWSNGFTPTRVILSGDSMTGFAVAQNDHSAPETFPRIPIALRRVACDGERS